MTEPIEKHYREFMNILAKRLDELINGKDCKPENKKAGFMLFVYDFNKGPEAGRMNYISNSNRELNAVSIKEFLAQLEGRYHQPPPTNQ